MRKLRNRADVNRVVKSNHDLQIADGNHMSTAQREETDMSVASDWIMLAGIVAVLICLWNLH